MRKKDIEMENNQKKDEKGENMFPRKPIRIVLFTVLHLDNANLGIVQKDAKKWRVFRYCSRKEGIVRGR